MPGEHMGRPPKHPHGSDRTPRVEKAISEAPATRNSVGALVNRRAADRLRSGHPWVYASDIESISLPEDAPAALLPVADHRGLLLGTALQPSVADRFAHGLPRSRRQCAVA